MIPRTLHFENNSLVILDQTELPLKQIELRLNTVDDVVDAIKKLKVRGAPAIGVAAAYGVALAAMNDPLSVSSAIDRLRASRPTAVNLFWALNRMEALLKSSAPTEKDLEEAMSIEDDDAEKCRRIGEYGSELLPSNAVVITHCNAGAMATAGIGTALAVIYKAVEKGKKIKVFVDETRPLLQGARITAWELVSSGIDATLITDNMAAAVMSRFKIDAVITGADRVAANGDAANKIGTFGLALAANFHKIPFYIAAPISTLDPNTPDGSAIKIEERSAEEVTEPFGKRIAPYGIKVFNPAFDVTPHHLIKALITDKGVFSADSLGVKSALND